MLHQEHLTFYLDTPFIWKIGGCLCTLLPTHGCHLWLWKAGREGNNFICCSCHPSGLSQSWVVIYFFTDRRTYSQRNHREYTEETSECWWAKKNKMWPWVIMAPGYQGKPECCNLPGQYASLPLYPHCPSLQVPRALIVTPQAFWGASALLPLGHCTKYWGLK